MNNKLIIFDFDDTLTDNTLRDVESFNFIIRKFNLPKIDFNQIIRWRSYGMLSHNILKRLLQSNEKLLLERCINARLNYLNKLYVYTNFVKLKPDVIRTLDILKKKNHILVVNSAGSDYKILTKLLSRFRIHRYFKKVYGKKDRRLVMKTTKDILEFKRITYKQILLDFNFLKKINDVLVIGNLKSDIIPANELKIKSIMIKGSFRFDRSHQIICHKIKKFDEILSLSK